MTIEPPTTDDRAIWDLWLSQYQLPVVLASDTLGVFKLIDCAALDLAQLGQRLTLSERSMEALMASLCGLGFVRKHQGRFYLTDQSRHYFLPESAFYWIPMLRGVSNGRDADDLLERLRSDNMAADSRVSRRWERGEMSLEDARSSNQRFHSHSMPAALGAAHAGDFRNVQRLLDVAGGSGCYSIAIARKCPWLRCTVADLPPVVADTATYIARYEVQDRVDTHAFNMFDDPWPTGYDAIFFSNVYHDWDPDRRTELTAKSFNALPSGGHIVLHEMLLDDNADGPLPAALFSIMMLGTRGKQFSFPQLVEMLTEGGFVDVEVRPSYGYYSLVTATRP